MAGLRPPCSTACCRQLSFHNLLQAVNISGRVAHAIPLTPRAPLQNIPPEALVGGARPPLPGSDDPLGGRNILLKVPALR